MPATVIARATVLVYRSGVYCGEAALLRDTARANRLDALMLKMRAQKVRAARSARPTARVLVLSGGSDLDEAVLAGLVVSVFLDRPTCLLCIAEKVGTNNLAVVRTIERMRATVRLVTSLNERCRACGSTLGPVYSLPR